MTLLKHLLTNAGGRRLAVIVDVAALNRWRRVAFAAHYVQTWSRQWLSWPSFDHIVIECTGMAEPLQVAASFLMWLALNEEGAEELGPLVTDLPSLKGLTHLDTCVTVVDVASFFEVLEDSGNSLVDASGSGTVDMKRPLLVDVMSVKSQHDCRTGRAFQQGFTAG